MMERRIAKLEALARRWSRPAPPLALAARPDFSALTPQEQFTLDQLLALVEGHQNPRRQGRPLTRDERRELDDLSRRCGVRFDTKGA